MAYGSLVPGFTPMQPPPLQQTGIGKSGPSQMSMQLLMQALKQKQQQAAQPGGGARVDPTTGGAGAQQGGIASILQKLFGQGAPDGGMPSAPMNLIPQQDMGGYAPSGAQMTDFGFWGPNPGFGA